ncbi:hypothetical protein BOTBODRAFT_38575 [Botryobasidium botryosum FD-172 SS1]|uniref:Uncharacterized protein n=1 Tax=Botryobasidium botryosum (strain FD-172 SS1) TaxID=930990 RepID=A0A067LWC8_BOTB1|nr:hypothetical protein BOTBODRAFT_38575 [Botryobasidium botryosum FD-172 SS1]
MLTIGTTQHELVIAVVGATSCGKTTVIRKGMKGWGIGEETTLYPGGLPSTYHSLLIEPSSVSDYRSSRRVFVWSDLT